jgi:hypothetical protein
MNSKFIYNMLGMPNKLPKPQQTELQFESRDRITEPLASRLGKIAKLAQRIKELTEYEESTWTKNPLPKS